MNNTQIDTDEVQVLKCVNDARIKKKQLKIRAFNIFHKCQYKCVESYKSKESQNCLKKCELDLDEYDKFKSEISGPEFKQMYWAIPQDNPEILTKFGLTQQELSEYSKKCVDINVRWQDRLFRMEDYLNNWEKNIKKKK